MAPDSPLGREIITGYKDAMVAFGLTIGSAVAAIVATILFVFHGPCARNCSYTVMKSLVYMTLLIVIAAGIWLSHTRCCLGLLKLPCTSVTLPFALLDCVIYIEISARVAILCP